MRLYFTVIEDWEETYIGAINNSPDYEKFYGENVYYTEELPFALDPDSEYFGAHPYNAEICEGWYYKYRGKIYSEFEMDELGWEEDTNDDEVIELGERTQIFKEGELIKEYYSESC